MEFLPPALEEYVEKHTSGEPPLLQQLNRETWLQALQPRMLSGHLQGRVLSMLSKMIRPKEILEIGTYTGYSALCLAEGLGKDGQLHTIEINEELKEMAAKYFEEAGMKNTIKQYIGNAMDIIPSIMGPFDLVFIDADKENYPAYYDLIFDKVRPGGYIIADNVLWSGKVLEPVKKGDLETQSLIDYSNKVNKDSRVENVLLPVRDGLMISRKK